MKKQSKKQIAARIQKAYEQSCYGIQIKMTDILKVWKLGEDLISTGVDDVTLAIQINKYVKQIAVG